MHWFFDKLHMTGSRAQWYNGILLLASFFSCRLLWGTYQSIRVYQDVWAGLHYTGLPGRGKALEKAENWEVGIMRFAREGSVPVWLASTYLGSNIVLNTLNFYWFGKMIETVKKRFRPAKGGAPAETVIVEGTEMDAAELFEQKDEKAGGETFLVEEKVSSITIDKHGVKDFQTEVRKRKV